MCLTNLIVNDKTVNEQKNIFQKTNFIISFLVLSSYFITHYSEELSNDDMYHTEVLPKLFYIFTTYYCK